MSNNETLMNENKQQFIDNVDDLKFTLQICGIKLTAIRTEPRLGPAAVKMLREKGIEVG